MTFSKYLTQWIHLEVPSNFVGELGQRQADYADIKHCIQCDGYKEHWSQMGTIAERMEFQYDTDFEKMVFYCSCGRKMNYSEYVFGSRSSECDSNSDTSCFSISSLCEIGVNPISLLINRLWHNAALDYRLFMFDKECGKKIMRETQISKRFIFKFRVISAFRSFC